MGYHNGRIPDALRRSWRQIDFIFVRSRLREITTTHSFLVWHHQTTPFVALILELVKHMQQGSRNRLVGSAIALVVGLTVLSRSGRTRPARWEWSAQTVRRLMEAPVRKATRPSSGGPEPRGSLTGLRPPALVSLHGKARYHARDLDAYPLDRFIADNCTTIREGSWELSWAANPLARQWADDGVEWTTMCGCYDGVGVAREPYADMDDDIRALYDRPEDIPYLGERVICVIAEAPQEPPEPVRYRTAKEMTQIECVDGDTYDNYADFPVPWDSPEIPYTEMCECVGGLAANWRLEVASELDTVAWDAVDGELLTIPIGYSKVKCIKPKAQTRRRAAVQYCDASQAMRMYYFEPTVYQASEIKYHWRWPGAVERHSNNMLRTNHCGSSTNGWHIRKTGPSGWPQTLAFDASQCNNEKAFIHIKYVRGDVYVQNFERHGAGEFNDCSVTPWGSGVKISPPGNGNWCDTFVRPKSTASVSRTMARDICFIPYGAPIGDTQ